MRTTRYPTFEELRALEFAARRARSRELLRLLKLGAKAVHSLLPDGNTKGVRHA